MVLIVGVLSKAYKGVVGLYKSSLPAYVFCEWPLNWLQFHINSKLWTRQPSTENQSTFLGINRKFHSLSPGKSGILHLYFNRTYVLILAIILKSRTQIVLLWTKIKTSFSLEQVNQKFEKKALSDVNSHKRKQKLLFSEIPFKRIGYIKGSISYKTWKRLPTRNLKNFFLNNLMIGGS